MSRVFIVRFSSVRPKHVLWSNCFWQRQKEKHGQLMNKWSWWLFINIDSWLVFPAVFVNRNVCVFSADEECLSDRNDSKSSTNSQKRKKRRHRWEHLRDFFTFPVTAVTITKIVCLLMRTKMFIGHKIKLSAVSCYKNKENCKIQISFLF